MTRTKVYLVALDIFRRDGLAAARIDDIVETAGVSRGTFYFHFPAKEDVLAERLALSERRIADELSDVPARTPLPAVLRAFCTSFADEWRAEPRLFPDVGMVALRATAGNLGGPVTSPVRIALAERFRQALDRREIAGTLPAELLSDFFLTNVFSATLAWCANPSLSLDTVLGGVVTLFFDGAGRAKKR